MLLQVQRQRSKCTLERVRRKSVRMAPNLHCRGPASPLRGRGSFAEISRVISGSTAEFCGTGKFCGVVFQPCVGSVRFSVQGSVRWSPQFLHGQDCHQRCKPCYARTGVPGNRCAAIQAARETKRYPVCLNQQSHWDSVPKVKRHFALIHRRASFFFYRQIW